jgi:hypothetical protein
MRTNHEQSSAVSEEDDLSMGRDLPADAAPVAFVDARRWQCVWPIDPVATPGHVRMLCCGAAVAARSPYCAGHAARARRETPPIQVEPPAQAAVIRRFAA